MIRITKREKLGKGQAVFIRICAVFLSLVCAGIFILAIGYNPFEILGGIVEGALATEMRLKETIIKAVPLVITSLGILVAFKMKFWNIGAEGQTLMGAFAASYVALNYDFLPKPVLMGAMMVAAVIGGGLWAFIPAFFKVKLGTNETIFTLMLNYIAIKWITYLQFGPWKDPLAQGFPKIATFSDQAVLPKVFGMHIGWVIALILIILVYIFMTYTKKGFEITVVGESVETARYAGMNVKKIIIIAMFISGGLCGLAGMIQASGVERTLLVSLSGGYGYTAIITTWLSGLSAPLVLVTSFAFAILLQGGNYIQIAFGISSAVAGMIQGMILFFVLGSEFFIQYKVGLSSPKKQIQEKGGK